MITYYTSLSSNSDKLQVLVELIYELMRLLEASDTLKKNAILEQNVYIDQFSSIVTLTIQVAKCGALSSVCYRCIVVIGSIVELSTATFLIELQKTANLLSLYVPISAFLCVCWHGRTAMLCSKCSKFQRASCKSTINFSLRALPRRV